MKKIILLLIVAFGLNNCTTTTDKQTDEEMLGIFKKGDKIDAFWTWFSKNQNRFRDFEDDTNKSDAYLNEILEQSRKIKEGLAFEIEPPKEGIFNLTVSADGDTALFSKVQEIVSKAPKIEGWRIFAFRQRIPNEQIKDLILEAQDHKLDPNKMKFFPIVQGDTLDIIVYADHVTDENRMQVAYGCLLLLDNILGEYDCVKKVRSFDFQTLPSNKKELSDLRPLIDIAAYVDSFYIKRN
jgi:hypothetical protein